MDAGRKGEKPSIFEVLLTPGGEEYVIPTPDQIKDEAYSILAAAADTTGNAMTVAAYHVVSNPELYTKLRAELVAAFPDPNAPLEFQKLEKLPYLVCFHVLHVCHVADDFPDGCSERGPQVGLPGAPVLALNSLT